MRELFVFGAGASHASGGTPLGKDLVWSCFEDCSTLYQIGPDGYHPAKADLEEKCRDFADFINFLGKMQNRYPALSGIVQKLNKAMEVGEFFDLRIEKPYYIDEIMEDLISNAESEDEIRLIRRIAAQHITQSSCGQSNSYYKGFVKSLKNRTREEVAIISFNFDCLLRDDLEDRIYFDYLIEFKEIDPRRCFYTPGQGIPLLKLHGSLDWKLNVDSDDITLLPVEWSTSYGGTPYIFLPHEQATSKIGQLWNAAAQFVRNSEKITFIGYSLPPYDMEAIKLFQSNIRKETHTEVIDFCKITIDRYKSLFSSHEIGDIPRDISKNG